MPQQPPPRRRPPASHLPLIALAVTVVLAVALPVAAATAGAAPSPHPPGSPRPSAAPSAPRSAVPEASAPGGFGGPSAGGTRTTCGPEVASTEGLSAQTCVVSEGGRTWARTYYRNATGTPLSAALTLMRPDGSSLRADCPMFVSGGTGVCTTPREKSRTGGAGYAATVEAGTADGERLLLRSGTNPRTR
jgi:hypothetical protein